LAHETVEVIYAAYLSAQEGRRIHLKRAGEEGGLGLLDVEPRAVGG
jgi:hypothetical protein